MTIKELLGYIGALLLGCLITRQLIIEFKLTDLISWLYSIPIIGYDTLLSLHLIRKLKNKKKDD